MSKKNKKIERICKNCRLFNENREVCSVIVLYEGDKINIPMDPNDTCMYESSYFDPTTKAMESFSEDIKEVKIWVENDKGEKVNGDGIVKIEYPDGFFGNENQEENISDKDSKE